MSEELQAYTAAPVPAVRDLDLFDENVCNRAIALAQQLSTATGFVPRHLLGNPGACLGVVSLASAWRVNPFLLASSSADVHGKLVWEAKAIQAGIERSGAVIGRLSYKYIGDWSKVRGKFTMRASASAKGEDGAPKQYAVPAWTQADEEGLAIEVTGTPAGESQPVTTTTYLKACHPRNSTLWATDPETQCRYRATRNWGRLVVPGVMLGATAMDEYEPQAERDITGQVTVAPAPGAAERLTRKKADAEAALKAEPVADAPKGERATPVTMTSVLAAIDATKVPRGVIVRYLQAQGKLAAGQGLDNLIHDQALMRAIYERPADLAASVKAWADEQAAKEGEGK